MRQAPNGLSSNRACISWTDLCGRSPAWYRVSKMGLRSALGAVSRASRPAATFSKVCRNFFGYLVFLGMDWLHGEQSRTGTSRLAPCWRTGLAHRAPDPFGGIRLGLRSGGYLFDVRAA